MALDLSPQALGIDPKTGQDTGNYQAPQGFFQTIGNNIGGAFKSGVNEAVSGYKQSANASNPFDLVGGAVHMITGAGAALASPLAAITSPTIGAGVNAASNAISDNPDVQNFAMSPAGQTTAKVASAVNTGANLVGTVGAGMAASDLVTNHPIFSPPPTPEDLVASRTADATPSLEQVQAKEGGITGTTVNPEGDVIPRVNQGKGLTGKQTVNTSKFEAEQEQELNNIKDFPDSGDKLGQSHAVGNAIKTEAENMREDIQAKDKANPLNTVAQKAKVSAMVKAQLPEDIQAKVGVQTPEEEAMLKGMQEKVGAPQPPGGKFDLTAPGEKVIIPRSPAGNFYKTVLDEVNNFDGSREGMLDLRQNIDTAYESARGKLAWGSDGYNEIDSVNTDIRNAINKELANTTENTDIQTSLKKQTNLYRAKSTIDWEANHQANSELGRVFQRHPQLKYISRILERQGIRIPLEVAGITGAGYAINKALTK